MGDVALGRKSQVVGYRSAVARTKQPPISAEDRRVVGALLRDLRKAAGYRSVDAAAAEEAAPSSRQTIYAYERGGLTPSLVQFLDLVEFYVLRAPHRDGAKPDDDLRAHGIAAVSRVLGLPLYHVAAAQDLIARMQPRMRRNR
jgi:DNA-binding XRE family transcriptional regulator